jgi:hypothetical protein
MAVIARVGFETTLRQQKLIDCNSFGNLAPGLARTKRL